MSSFLYNTVVTFVKPEGKFKLIMCSLCSIISVKMSCLFLTLNRHGRKLQCTKGTPFFIFVIGTDDGPAFLAEKCSLYSSLILCFVERCNINLKNNWSTLEINNAWKIWRHNHLCCYKLVLTPALLLSADCEPGSALLLPLLSLHIDIDWIKVYDANHGVDSLPLHLEARESASWMLIFLRYFNSSSFLCLVCPLLPHLTQNEMRLWRVLITSIKKSSLRPICPLA